MSISPAATQSVQKAAKMLQKMWGNGSNSVVGGVRKLKWSECQPMVYPYTLSGMWVQFPYKFFFKQCWWPRYILYSCIILQPLWVYIHFKVNSPEAKLAWKQKKERDFKKEHLKEWELLDDE